MLKKDLPWVYKDKCIANANFSFTIQLPDSFTPNSIRNMLQLWSKLCLNHSCVKCPVGRNDEIRACSINYEVRNLIKQLRR